jgi:hypothetical protein
MDKMEFTASLNSRKMKVTGNSIQELHERWIKLASTVEPSVADKKEYWLNRIKSSRIKYDRAKLEAKPAPKLSEAWHAGLAIVKQAQGDIVTQAEHNRRAAICSRCPLSSEVSICMACGGGGKISSLIGSIRNHIGKNTIKIDDKVRKKYCGVCGCFLPLLSITKTQYLPKETPEENRLRPIGCWIRKDSPNYKPEAS